VKGAARRRINGRGRFPLKDYSFFDMTGICLGNRGKQGLGIGMQGISEKSIRFSLLYNTAQIHNPYSMGDIFYYVYIMSHCCPV
jgi:hypothetical protein